MRFPIITVTLFVLIYNTRWIASLFIVSPFPVIGMVYRILKDSTPTSKTWDGYFYEDHAYGAMVRKNWTVSK